MTADESDLAAEIEGYRARLVTPGMTAGEFAALLPEHLRGPYWNVKIGELARQQGLDPDDPDLHRQAS
jgi:hypothetical protein